MSYRTANYSAFYVSEPFSPHGLGAYGTPDFNLYMMLRMWKIEDSSFPFVDAHRKTYSVRDGSSWESTLKPRLRERLRLSKNIILFLSSRTRASKALTEEMEYGMGDLGLPVIVVYPEFAPIEPNGRFDSRVYDLWNRLPAFEKSMASVPTLHIPLKKEPLKEALSCPGYTIQHAYNPGIYRLP